MKRLCIDEDTSDKVCIAMRKLRPSWNIVFVRQWAGGGTKDPVLLDLLWEDRRALISRDRATMPEWIKERQARGVDHAGILFWDLERFSPGAIGAVAHAAVRTIERYHDLTNVVATIR